MHYLNFYLMPPDCHTEGKLRTYVNTVDVAGY